jgi:hypothetical protein
MNNPQPWWLTMPVAEVAAAILPVFSNSVYEYEVRWQSFIVNWFKTGSYSEKGYNQPGVQPFRDPDYAAVAEATQALEHAGLLLRTIAGPSYLGLTRLGRHALQTNTVRQHLGLGDAPPTA